MSALAALRCAAVLILLPIIFGDHDGVLVDTSLGEAGATSVLWNDDKSYSADYAFKNMAIKDGDYTNLAWISYGFPTESAPETVYIRLATPVTVSRFSFETKSGSSWDSNWTPWAPTKFELVGSADCENWTVLKSVEGENWTKKDERKEWNVQSDASYECLGIRTFETKNNYVAIHDLKFYKASSTSVEIDWEQGRPGASSQYDSHNNINRAFQSASHPWANAKSDKFPVMVWNRFPDKWLESGLRVASFSFSSKRKDWKRLEQSPTDFELVGSDHCKDWTSISSFQPKFTKAYEVKSWDVAVDERKAFRCIGIKINKVGSGPFAAIQNLKMYAESDLVRNDGRCGPDFLMNGKPGQCSPYGKGPCCSPYVSGRGGYCGKTSDHCKCANCIDYRKEPKL